MKLRWALFSDALPPPVKKNDVNSDQDGDQQNNSFGQDQPVGFFRQPFRLIAGCQLLQLLMAPEEPVDPEDQYQYPENLDADKGEQWMEKASEQFHMHSYYHCTKSRTSQFLHKYYISKVALLLRSLQKKDRSFLWLKD